MDKRNERHEFNANRTLWDGVERRKVHHYNTPVFERRSDARAQVRAEQLAIIQRLGA